METSLARWIPFWLIILGLFTLSCGSPVQTQSNSFPNTPQSGTISLPAPQLKGTISLEETLQARRSIRSYTSEPLTLNEVSQILWAAQGQTSESGGRTAPSAGALYPLEVYLVAGNVQDLTPGVYQYIPAEHQINKIKDVDIRNQLTAAALNQSNINDGAISLVMTAIYSRSTAKYGDRGIRYAQLEAGHAAQNVCLQVTALGLGAVTIGAFEDDQVKTVIGLSDDEAPLYIIPVGRKAE